MLGIKLRNDWAYYALFQYFWILVLLPKAVQLLALGGLMCLFWFRTGRAKPLDGFTLLQLAFLLIYGVSIAVNALWADHETNRILAAVNTWGITAVALGFYHFYRDTHLELHRLGKYSLINIGILLCLYGLYLAVGDRLPSILGHSLTVQDWVDEVETSRFIGYLDYSNLVVFFVLFFYPLALYYLRRHRILAAGMTLLLFLPVYATNSRTGLVLYLVVLLAYGLFGLQKRFFAYYRQRRYVLLTLSLICLCALALLLAGQLLAVFNRLLTMREGSNDMRLAIYETSLKTMLEQSPVFGIGIKDMLGVYPLGSHSTYIGVFYKAGLLGGLIYMASIVLAGAKSFLRAHSSRHLLVLLLCVLAAMLLMALEDVDGTNWCVCCFYVLLALLQSKQPERTLKI